MIWPFKETGYTGMRSIWTESGMTFSKPIVLCGLAAVLALAGCQSERFSSVDTRPAPLPPAPAGAVTASQLPAPAAPAATSPSGFPEAPTAPGAAADPTQIAAAPPPDAPEVTTGSVAGVWNASVAGQTCRVATPQTKFGQGFRAGPLRCPAPLDGVKSWNVSGQQLALYDEGGAVLARLYSSGQSRFDGQTSSGLPISLSR